MLVPHSKGKIWRGGGGAEKDLDLRRESNKRLYKTAYRVALLLLLLLLLLFVFVVYGFRPVFGLWLSHMRGFKMIEFLRRGMSITGPTSNLTPRSKRVRHGRPFQHQGRLRHLSQNNFWDQLIEEDEIGWNYGRREREMRTYVW
jgi:hypothetical protein